uniref:Phosphate transporter n=1 Tax=Schmidtea mediterranea TaxID=79327 RepID=A0A0H3YF29_SCHMD|nr:slc20a-2 [Schmidtea mediterranea]
MMIGQLSSLSGRSLFICCMKFNFYLGGCLWLLVATFLKLPVSGSHSIVGAMVGFALIIQGPAGIAWKKLGMIVASWFVSPLLSGLVSAFVFFIFDKFILKKSESREPALNFLPFIYAITIFINFFSIFLTGPTLLKFDKIPLYGNFIISIGLSVITIIVVRFALVPYLRKIILKSEPIEGVTVVSNVPSVEEVNENLDINIDEDTQTNKLNSEEETITIKISEDKETETETDLTKKEMCEVSLEDIKENSTEVECKTVEKTVIKDKPELVTIFSWVQVLTAIFGSFAHGGNDVSNAIGPLVGLWIIAITQDVYSTEAVPIWVLVYGGLGITVGLWVWGRRVMKTIGDDLTTITPTSGVSIELGAAVTVLIASNIGIPISTTHCKVGSIVAVGRYRSNDNVDWSIFRNICFAWLVTVPVSAGISALTMFLLRMLI